MNNIVNKLMKSDNDDIKAFGISLDNATILSDIVKAVDRFIFCLNLIDLVDAEQIVSVYNDIKEEK